MASGVASNRYGPVLIAIRCGRFVALGVYSLVAKRPPAVQVVDVL